MSRWTAILGALLVCALVTLGCSGGGNPVTPMPEPEAVAGTSNHGGGPQTHLWGFYDVYIDIENLTVEAVPNRQAMFSANVVTFVNNNPANLSFKINSTPIGTDYVDVDIDVGITHPFPGLTEYNGYDVRGIFIGDASGSLDYNSDLDYAVLGADQFMQDFDDGLDGQIFGDPDGYTRWWNPIEFKTPGVLGYTQGKLATPGYMASATLNPYKCYADGLGVADDAWTWLNANSSTNAVFSAGSTNTRNYYLRFPNSKGIRYNYAIVANWEATDVHPSNAPEASAISVAVTPDVYWVPPSGAEKGGDLILDVNVWGWNGIQPSTIFVESTVLSAVHEFDSTEMTPVGGDANYSTYHAEILADNVTGNAGQEFWVICQYDEYGYTNEFGVTNLAGTDPLAAFFRYPLFVAEEPYNLDPVCDVQVITPMPYSGWATEIEFDASASYDPEGGALTFEWDFNGDDVFGDPYDSGTDDHPFKYYDADYVGDVCVRVSDPDGGEAECCVAVDITAYPSKNIPLREGVDAYDLAVDHADGDLLILYADGQVWRYLESAYYQSGSLLFTTTTGCDRIDISPNSYIIAGGNNNGTVNYSRSYTPTGSPLSTHSVPSPYGLKEVIGITSTTMTNYHASITGFYWVDYIWLNRYPPTGYSGGSGNLRTNAYGIGGLHYDLVLGCESSSESYYIYILEDDPEFRVERYSLYLGYASVYWGGQATGMSGFWDPKDISRDDQNDYYILDQLDTGEPRIKHYEANGSPHGQFGDSTEISGDPLRIEGSDYNRTLFVLHSDGLSIFPESEIN